MDSKHDLFTHAKVVLERSRIDSVVRHALVEDVGHGDITTYLTIAEDKMIEADLIAKEECIVCGLEVAQRAFELTDHTLTFEACSQEGRHAKAGKVLAKVRGKARSILTAERVAINLLSMMSGIATKTRMFVDKVEPHKVKVTDTRKTLPGLRYLQKYAVRTGGGYNHRMSLDEMVLIKDNHLKVTEGYSKFPKVPKGFKIEVECQNLDEFKHALRFKPDIIMLDNMRLEDIREAVAIRNGTAFTSHHPRTLLEVSGGVNLDTIADIAATGVDVISIGALTHSVDSVDISLEVVS